MLTPTLLSLLRSRRPDGPLPRAFYCAPELHEADLRDIWARGWIFAASAAELPEAGCDATLQVSDYPVVVVRSADGAVPAFHNVCRHCGSRVCAGLSGRLTRLLCPHCQ